METWRRKKRDLRTEEQTETGRGRIRKAGVQLSGGALACSGPWIKFSSTGKMERKRKNESRREEKARGDHVGKVDTGYWGGGGLEDMGLGC